MKYMLILLAAALLLGCVAEGQMEQPEEHEEPLPGNNATLNCNDYCVRLPHIQCVGSWNISGTYPDCSCDFVCDTGEVQENDTGETVQEPVEETEEYEPLADFINKSLDEMVNESIAKIRSDFYRKNSGSFEHRTYTWKRLAEKDALPGAIAFDLAPATNVKFDDTQIKSIQASGFTVFTNTGTDEVNTIGFAIFNDSITMLDGYTGSDAFDIWYFPQIIDKDLRDCWVSEKVINKNENGWVSTYYFQCERVYDK